jgi:hypothetical protein
VAAATFWVALDDGTFGTESRASLGIGVWWCILLAVIFGMWPPARLRVHTVLAMLSLAGFAALTLASMTWAANPEAAFGEFNRVALYLGVFVLVVIAQPWDLRAWCDGLAAAIVAIALLALATRCFPGIVDTGSAFTFLAAGVTRLNYPLGYWNALGILTGLGVPLLLRAAVAAQSLAGRALAVAALPPCAATIFLTSSRTGVLVSLLAVFLFFVLVPVRAATAGALAAGGLGCAVAIEALLRRHALVDGPLGTAAARHEGWTAAVAIAVAAVGGAAAYAVGIRLLAGRQTSRRLERLLLVAGVGVAVAAILLAHPVRRGHEFAQPPTPAASALGPGYVQNHLLSASGNGRWDYWKAAVAEFEAHPVLGDGAGSYAAWWLQHRDLRDFVRNAHSLFLESLGELGVIGLVLIAGFFAVGLSGARKHFARDRVAVAALTSVLSTFVVAAGLDWVWQIPAVALVGVVTVAVLSARASDLALPAPRRQLAGAAAGITLAAIAIPLIGTQAVMMLTDQKLRQSESAARRGDGVAAAAAAGAARNLEPWAASPYVQLALVGERLGDLRQARTWTVQATRRDPSNWAAWLVRARLETKLADVPSARVSLGRARKLNPLAFPPGG